MMITKNFFINLILFSFICVTGACADQNGDNTGSFSFTIGDDEDQENERSGMKLNSVYLEIGGQGVGATFNYDRLLRDSDNSIVNFSVHIGAGTDIIGFTVPMGFNILVGRTHYFESGVGMTLFVGQEDTESYTFGVQSVLIGYRYQPAGGGFVFRAGYFPVIGWGANWVTGLPWFGISFGKAF